MTAHDHSEYVPGCFRCELGRDEERDSKSMKILVTGAAGFIAQWLMPELERRGHDVFATDLTYGFDLAQFNVAFSEVAACKPHMVLHLAAQPGRVFGEGNVNNTLRANVLATINVARACHVHGARLCYFSTSEVYGPTGQHKAWEDWTPRPNNLYGLTKFWGEQAVEMYAPEGLIIVRPSMPYGPFMPVGAGRAALPTMLANALMQQPYQVHRGAARSWCWIEDTVKGLVDVIERGEGIYNVGREDDLRPMIDIARMAYEMAGADTSLITEVDPPERISLVKNLSDWKLRQLGWKPLVPLEEGMGRVLRHLRLELADDVAS